MRKIRKKTAVLIAIALALVFGIAVGGTIAYLTAKSNQVTNTFTVGNIQIELKEHENGKDGTEVEKREGIKLLPGVAVDKDPFVRVKAGSEKCYVYMRYLNGLTYQMNPAVDLEFNEDWILVKPVGTEGSNDTGWTQGLYRYKEPVEATDDLALPPLFTTGTLHSDVVILSENDAVNGYASLDGKTIAISAFAIQAEGIELADADAAAINALWTPWSSPNP